MEFLLKSMIKNEHNPFISFNYTEDIADHYKAHYNSFFLIFTDRQQVISTSNNLFWKMPENRSIYRNSIIKNCNNNLQKYWNTYSIEWLLAVSNLYKTTTFRKYDTCSAHCSWLFQKYIMFFLSSSFYFLFFEFVCFDRGKLTA